MSGCYYCGDTEKDTRPYGPGGAPACFACAFASPERKLQTEGAFDALMNAATVLACDGAVAVGSSAGPQPVSAAELAAMGLDGEAR